MPKISTKAPANKPAKPYPFKCFACRAVTMGLALSVSTAFGQSPTITDAVRDPGGWYVHQVTSPYQQGETEIRILVPEKSPEDERFPVVYVLPVEARNEHRYGDGLAEIKRHDLHNIHRAIFVAPTFSHLPCYADHPTEPAIRQESHFIQVVVPYVEKHYPVVGEPKGRLLLGFSKSGWGAWSLLLRYPDFFGRAAAWDAPLMLDKPGKYGSGEVFGSVENFANYRISTALRAKAGSLRGSKRLVLLGYGGFRQEHRSIHALLEKLELPHVYRDGPERKHDWHSGWVPEAVELLIAVDQGSR